MIGWDPKTEVLILLRLNLEVHIFHSSRGGRLAALVGVCIVWNLEPLASGGQSGHKLIPHIICQFLCAREKNLWTRTYSTRDQVPTCLVFTRAKIKSRFGILKNLPSQYTHDVIKMYSNWSFKFLKFKWRCA